MRFLQFQESGAPSVRIRWGIDSIDVICCSNRRQVAVARLSSCISLQLELQVETLGKVFEALWITKDQVVGAQLRIVVQHFLLLRSPWLHPLGAA